MDGASLDKFRKIAGLLGSEHDGERATAALMASRLLKQHGLTWNAISVNSTGPSGREGMLLGQLHHTMALLEDERRRTTRMSEQISNLNRRLRELEARAAEAEKVMRPQMPLPDPPKRKRRRKVWEAPPPDPGPNQQYRPDRTVEEGDDAMRAAMSEALLFPDLPDRTREFFASVLDWKAWTVKQREAIERSLGWVYREGR